MYSIQQSLRNTRNTKSGFVFYLKLSIFPFLLVTMMSFGSTTTPHPVDVLYQQANGRLSESGASFMKQNYVYHTEPCQKIPTDGGGLWRCIYADGLVVYNCFKLCRGTIEAGEYFLGISGGDCDSFTFVDGKKYKVCYPDQVGALLRIHGKVVAIERFRKCM